jgi:hypothetical protein
MTKMPKNMVILLVVIVLISTQFACEFVNVLRSGMKDDAIGDVAADSECASSGGTWTYDSELGEWYCDFSNVEPAPEPPLWNPPEEPEAVETLEPEECNQRAAVDIGMGPNDNTLCGCAYFVHFTSYEETILYYRTQTYVDPNDPRQRWQVQRLFAGETWTWSSETIEDGVCVPAVIDMYAIFIAIEGCDNMAKRAHWAIDEYSRPLTGLCP